VCKGCYNKYEGGKSDKNFVEIVFCCPCRKIRGKDIMEIILVNQDGTESITYCHNEDHAQQLLMNMKSDIRLDLHKTLDTLAINTKLPHTSVCCLSFVGNFTQTRIGARENIIERIKSNQIRFGILVFKRGPKKDPELCNRFHEIGSKAWVNKYLGKDSNNVVFIDDSDDHVYSVQSIDSNIKSIKLCPRSSLLNVLEKLLVK